MKIKQYHKDLEALHIGCEKPRAYFIPYQSEEVALAGKREASSNLINLCGEWNFKFYKSFEDIEDDFLKAGQVMKLLNITRQTLCHYVTQGIIRTYRKKPNGQYLYDKEDVNKIFIDKNKKQSWKKESK